MESTIINNKNSIVTLTKSEIHVINGGFLGLATAGAWLLTATGGITAATFGYTIVSTLAAEATTETYKYFRADSVNQQLSRKAATTIFFFGVGIVATGILVARVVETTTAWCWNKMVGE